jgi:hypothetical protein
MLRCGSAKKSAPEAAMLWQMLQVVASAGLPTPGASLKPSTSRAAKRRVLNSTWPRAIEARLPSAARQPSKAAKVTPPAGRGISPARLAGPPRPPSRSRWPASESTSCAANVPVWKATIAATCAAVGMCRSWAWLRAASAAWSLSEEKRPSHIRLPASSGPVPSARRVLKFICAAGGGRRYTDTTRRSGSAAQASATESSNSGSMGAPSRVLGGQGSSTRIVPRLRIRA